MSNVKFENQYEDLNKKELTRYEIMELSWAIGKLAEALNDHSTWQALQHVQSAQRDLTAFVGKIVPLPKLNAKEGNLSRALHTYMRKGMDSHLSVMLYRMIAENRGMAVWYAFIKGLSANKLDFRVGMEAACMAAGADGNTDNLLMKSALWMWKEDFRNALEWMKG